MKIDSPRLDFHQLLKAPPKLILLYGSDPGLIDFLGSEIRESVRRDGHSFKRAEETSVLAPLLTYFQPDLFSDPQVKTFVFIENISEKNTKIYQEILSIQIGGTLILTSLKLRAASVFVQKILKQPDTWAIACYPPELGAKSALFQQSAQRIGLTFTPEALKTLVPSLALTEIPQVLEKLRLWHAENPLTLETTNACLGETGGGETDFVYALSGRDSRQLSAWIVQAGEGELLLAIRQATRHFMSLLTVKSALYENNSLDAALSSLSPPLFFKQLPAFKAHLPKWSIPQLHKAIAFLAQAEIAFKKGAFDKGYTAFLREVIAIP